MTRNGIVYRFWAGITAILVLAGSVGIAIDVHFCHDTVKSIGVYTLADDCSSVDSEITHLPYEMCEDGLSLTDNGCCHNESFLNKISTEAAIQNSNNQIQDSKYTESIWQISKIAFTLCNYGFVDLAEYVPLPKNRQVLFQSFLI